MEAGEEEEEEGREGCRSRRLGPGLQPHSAWGTVLGLKAIGLHSERTAPLAVNRPRPGEAGWEFFPCHSLTHPDNPTSVVAGTLLGRCSHTQTNKGTHIHLGTQWVTSLRVTARVVAGSVTGRRSVRFLNFSVAFTEVYQQFCLYHGVRVVMASGSGARGRGSQCREPARAGNSLLDLWETLQIVNH